MQSQVLGISSLEYQAAEQSGEAPSIMPCMQYGEAVNFMMSGHNIVGSQWSYNNVSSLFIKNETYTGKTQEPEERGRKEPHFCQTANHSQGWAYRYVSKSSIRCIKYSIVEDYNTGIRDCTFFKSQFLNKEENGHFVRSSTATGYLNRKIVTQGNEFHPDEVGVGSRNLVILAKTTVNKILFEDDGRFKLPWPLNLSETVNQIESTPKRGLLLVQAIFPPLYCNVLE